MVLEAPVLSVIVPYRDADLEIAALLRALGRQTLPLMSFEVVVVDDGSQGDPLAAIEIPRGLVVRRFRTERQGAYAARNLGLSRARAERFAFTDADCTPRPQWLERGLAALEHTPRVAGAVSTPPPTTIAGRIDATRFFRQERYAQEGFGATANLFVRREVVRSVGGFDARLRSGADAEWGLRAQKAQWPIAFAADAVVEHRPRDRLMALLSKAHRVGFGVGQAMRLGLLSPGHVRARASDRARVSLDASGEPSGARVVRAVVMLTSLVGCAQGVVLGDRPARRPPKPRR